MFMGHYAPAVWDTKRGHAVPLIPLWLGFLAVQFIDIIFASLAIFGVEGAGTMIGGVPIFDIPYSHSLLSALILSIIGAAIFMAIVKPRSRKAFFVFALLIFSHWILDLVVHRPDLPLYPGGELMLGFGVWNYPLAAFVLEMGLLLLAFVFWMHVTVPISRIFSIAPWILFTLMGALQYFAIVMPGLQVQNGTFDMAAAPQGVFLGISALLVFAFIAGAVAAIERGRPSKFKR
ncbi:hypothetical protein [Robiginitomaculum antarcticum]|uniref:hypothetical protein n=1 Tax=Robiginitomaculum antarcticum TaxID=437507 RepID=UPI0003809C50|nr:hypothetical protein [Robiginitomaculum antarcticum]